MSRILHIFDMGPFIHAGSVNTHSFIEGPIITNVDGYRQSIIPTGGLAQILNTLADIDPEETCIFCADRRPTIKQGMYSGYKSNRNHNHHIEIQKEIAEIILKDCGYEVLFDDGYEADDFIYSLVEKYKSDYDHIYVYTGDSDLYFLVCENVSIRPSSTRAKTVTMENYSFVVSSKCSVPYNTLTYNKILGGDRSDNIPPLSKETCKQLEFFTRNTALYPHFGEREFLFGLAKGFGREFQRQVELVYPLLANIPQQLINRCDVGRVKTWGGLIRAKRYHRLSEPPEDYKLVIDELMAKQLYED